MESARCRAFDKLQRIRAEFRIVAFRFQNESRCVADIEREHKVVPTNAVAVAVQCMSRDISERSCGSRKPISSRWQRTVLDVQRNRRACHIARVRGQGVQGIVRRAECAIVPGTAQLPTARIINDRWPQILAQLDGQLVEGLGDRAAVVGKRINLNDGWWRGIGGVAGVVVREDLLRRQGGVKNRELIERAAERLIGVEGAAHSVLILPNEQPARIDVQGRQRGGLGAPGNAVDVQRHVGGRRVANDGHVVPHVVRDGWGGPAKLRRVGLARVNFERRTAGGVDQDLVGVPRVRTAEKRLPPGLRRLQPEFDAQVRQTVNNRRRQTDGVVHAIERRGVICLAHNGTRLRKAHPVRISPIAAAARNIRGRRAATFRQAIIGHGLVGQYRCGVRRTVKQDPWL